jgi:hypothetical protein
MIPASTLSHVHSNHLTHSRGACWRLLTVADDSLADDAAAAASTGSDASTASPDDNASVSASDGSATASSFVDVVDVEAVKRAAAATVSCLHHEALHGAVVNFVPKALRISCATVVFASL